MRCKKDGFTLIELLVAISILAIVAVLGFRGLDSIIRTRTILTADLELTRNLQITFAQLQSDCLQTVNQLSYSNLPENRSFWVEPRRLILIRNEYSDDDAPAMQIVVYRIKNNSLTRFESDATRDLGTLKKFLIQAKKSADDQSDIVLLTGVDHLQFKGFPEPGQNSDFVFAFGEFQGGPDAEMDSGAQPEDSDSDDSDESENSGNSGNDAPASGQNPQKKNDQSGAPVQNMNKPSDITGLQVQLQLSGHEKRIYKIFVVGGS